MRRRGPRLLAFACAALLVAGCTPSADQHLEPRPSQTGAATKSSSHSAISASTTMNCANPVTASSHPPDGAQVALGIVAIRGLDHPAPGIPTAAAPYRYLMKFGISVRTGRQFTLRVHDQPETRVAIAWGANSPHWTTRLVVPGCSYPGDSARWHSYPGGFATDADACLHLTVRAAGRTESIDVPAAAPCPAKKHDDG